MQGLYVPNVSAERTAFVFRTTELVQVDEVMPRRIFSAIQDGLQASARSIEAVSSSKTSYH